MAAELATLLQALQSADNAQRGAAEKQYEIQKSTQPAPLTSGLIQVLAEPSLPLPIREQAAVLLRQCLANAGQLNSIWVSLGTDQARAQVKASLLQALGGEPQDKVRRKVADCVQSLANDLIDVPDGQRPNNADAWPELLPALLQTVCDTARAAGVRADALWTLRRIVPSVWPMLVANAQQTAQIIRNCFADGAEAVRGGAAALLLSMVAALEVKTDRQAFMQLIPELCDAIAQVAGAPDSKPLQEVLEIIGAEGSLVQFLKDHLGSHVLNILCQVARSHPDENARKLALEALVTLFEAAPKTLLKVPECARMILEVCVNFAMQLEEEPGWEAADEEDVEEESDNHKCGCQAVDRICSSAQRADCLEQVMAPLQPAIAQLLQQSDWKSIASGLALLTQICEYVDEEATVDTIVSAVSAQLQNGHARVRHFAWFTLLQFAQDQSQAIITDAWAAKLLPVFLSGLGDACPRVVFACMGAFQNYAQQTERENLEPFADPFMKAFGQKLQQGSRGVQREAISCIAALAQQLKDGVAQYYSALMPVLKQIINATIHKVEERELLGKTFECVSLFADAVGRQTFRPEAEMIMEAMLRSCQVPELPKDDPIQEYMLAAAERICTTLKDDFVRFIPQLLLVVLPKFQVAPKEYNGNLNDFDGDNVNLSVVRDAKGSMKALVMSTSELEDLERALGCVSTLVVQLGAGYGPFISQTAQALLPVFGFLMSENVRNLAFETWGQLCASARDGGQSSVLSDLCQEFMRRIIPQLDADDPNVEASATRAIGVAKCLRKAGPGILSAEQVLHISGLSMLLISKSIERVDLAKRQAVAKSADLDETRDDDDSEEAEDTLRASASAMVIALMQHHADHFAARSLPACLQAIQQLLQPSNCTGYRGLGLHIAGGIFQHLGDKASAQWPQFLPQVLQDMHDQCADVRGTACCAVSYAARNQSFQNHAAETACRAAELVAQTRARSKKKSEKAAQCAADNAVSVLAELLAHHQATLGASQPEYWKTYLGGLPCQEDDVEGLRNNTMLLQLMQQQSPGLLGEANQNLPRVLALLVDAYKTEQTNEQVEDGIRKLFLSAGNAQLQQNATGLTPKQQKKLQRIVKEAQSVATVG